MVRGRKPKSVVDLRLSGSRQGGESRAAKPTTDKRYTPSFRQPEWLDATGRAKWRELHRLLTGHGVIDTTDAGLLARYCDTYSRWRAARNATRKHGECYSVTDKNGNTRWIRYHESRIATELLRALSDMEQQMGLTPMSRPRIRTTPGESPEEGSGPERPTGLEKYI